MSFWIYCGQPMTEGQIHTARQNLDILRVNCTVSGIMMNIYT
jgi:hypothetical protein